MKKLIFLSLICVGFFNSNAQIVINEVLASNTWVKADTTFGNYGDWIELYNPSSEEVLLQGYQVSDRADFSKFYTIDDWWILKPNEYLLLWADGEDLQYSSLINYEWNGKALFSEAFHLNFKLKQEGEGVYLKDNKGVLIDSVVFGAQISDVSLARSPVDMSWGYDGLPTPGFENKGIIAKNLSLSEEAVFSEIPGYKSNAFQLTLSSPVQGTTIYYTLDGTRPTKNDSVFKTPITIDKTVTVRAISVEDNKLASSEVFASYNFVLPSLFYINLTVDENDLWDTRWGIYENSRKDHEVPASLEYFDEQGKFEYQVNAGVELFGSTIFQLEQKPFNISIKGKYGDEVLEYPLFDDKCIPTYKNFVLRNGGNDFASTMMRDGFMATLGSEMKYIQYQAYKPVAVYLNGSYWGLYNIREKMNAEYLASNEHVNPDRLDLIEESVEVKEGSIKDFDRMIFDLQRMSEISEINYKNFLKEWIDIDRFIDHIILKSYVGYRSFNVNNKHWRNQEGDDRWKWLSFDMEHGFGCCGGDAASANTLQGYLDYETEPDNVLTLYIFQRLWEVEVFRDLFIKRYQTYLESTLSVNNVLGVIDSLEKNIEGEMYPHLQRWNPTLGYSGWKQEVDKLRLYAVERNAALKTHLETLSKGMETFELNLITSIGGDIELNEVGIDEVSWTGNVYEGTNIIKAIPNSGYRFTNWSNGKLIPQQEILIDSDTLFTAYFEVDQYSFGDTVTTNLVFNNKEHIYSIDRDLIIEKGASLLIKEGVTVQFADKVNLIVYGALKVEGTKAEPVVLQAKNDLWGTISAYSAEDTLSFKHVKITGSHYGFKGSLSAIHSINSNLVVEACSITNCRQPIFTEGGSVSVRNSLLHMGFVGDLVNVTKTANALIEGNEFRGNLQQDTDAIDFDGVTDGVIRGNWIYGFRGENSDGIDLGEASKNILIEDNEIYFCSDKGVSVGQSSVATITNNIITLCGQGVGVKDEGSTAYVHYNTLDANILGLASFEKNPGVGGGKIIAHHNLLTNSDVSALFVDDLSVLSSESSLYEDVVYKNEALFDFSLTSIDSTIGASITYSDERHPKVIINEINYKSADSCSPYSLYKEWVEFKNVGENDFSLTGWSFSDGEQIEAFKEGYYDLYEGYAVLQKVWIPSSLSLLSGAWEYEFKLSNEGERLYLFDEKGMVSNSIYYKIGGEWPGSNGFPIALNVSSINNVKGESWFANDNCRGTWLKPNDYTIGFEYGEMEQVLSVYPNPTSGIVFLEESNEYSVLSLFGVQVLKGEGTEIDFSNLPNGVYLVRVNGSSQKIVKQ